MRIVTDPRCDLCGDEIADDDEFVEVGVEIDPERQPLWRVARIHLYLCLPTYRVKHRHDQRPSAR
jgi:hypothetical protein